MRERAAGRIVSCRVDQIVPPANISGPVYIPMVYDLDLEIEVGEAVIPIRRFQPAAPRSAVGNTVEVEWQDGVLTRIMNATTGEVLMDKNADGRILAIAGLVAIAAVAAVVFLALQR